MTAHQSDALVGVRIECLHGLTRQLRGQPGVICAGKPVVRVLQQKQRIPGVQLHAVSLPLHV